MGSRQVRALDEVVDGPPVPTRAATRGAAGADRGLRRFLLIGSAALLALLLGVGALYYVDQRTPRVPSIVQQQIGRAEEAVRADPNDVNARLTLGVMYHEAGRLDEALTQLDEVLRVAPDNPDAHMAKGAVFMERGDLLGASAEYTTVSRSFGEGEFAGADTRLQASLYWLGVIALRQNQPQEALTRLDQALRINPTDSDALVVYGQALGRLGRHEDAVAAERRALTFVPYGWCDPYQQMRDSFAALGRPDQASWAEAMTGTCRADKSEAVQRLTSLVETSAGVDAMLGLGQIAQMAGAQDSAIEWYSRALERDPQNIAAMGALSDLGATPPARK